MKRTIVYFSSLWNYGLIDCLHVISIEGDTEKEIKEKAIKERESIDKNSRCIGIAYVEPNQVPTTYSRAWDAIVNRFYDAKEDGKMCEPGKEYLGWY